MERAAEAATKIMEIDQKIVESKKRVEQARRASERRTASEVADRFNTMYRAR
jgi:hypothetical protein